MRHQIINFWWGRSTAANPSEKAKEERQAIIVFSGGQIKRLGVPKIDDSLSDCQANAVIDALDEWGL